jgi:plastocyanin
MKRATGQRARIAIALLAITATAGGALALGLNARASTRAVKVTVTEREYRITLSRKTLKAGTVSLLIVNRGKLAHDFAIKGPGVSKRIAGTIAPGSHRTLVVHLKGGKYSVWCPIHATKGMKATISVSGATAVSGTTTSSGGGGGGWG